MILSKYINYRLNNKFKKEKTICYVKYNQKKHFNVLISKKDFKKEVNN